MEIDLKDDFEIVENGHSYTIPQYKVEEGKGILKTKTPLNIKFVRGSKLRSDKIDQKEGTLHEHLISMMLHDLKLKNSIVPSRETSIVITKLEEALMWQQKRSIDRSRRNVQETYKE